MYFSFLSSLTYLLFSTPALGAVVRGRDGNNNDLYLKAASGSYAGRYLYVMGVSGGSTVLALASDTSTKSPVNIDPQTRQLKAPDPLTDYTSYAAVYYSSAQNTVAYLGPDQQIPGQPVSGFQLASNGTLTLTQANGGLNGFLACGKPSDDQAQLYYSQTSNYQPEPDCEWVSLQASS